MVHFQNSIVTLNEVKGLVIHIDIKFSIGATRFFAALRMTLQKTKIPK